MKSDFPELVATIEEGMAIGLHIGAVVHVRKAGDVVADFAVGAAALDPPADLSANHKLLWLSAGKPLTALAAGILVDRGRINFDDLVSDHIPEFAHRGKETITIKNLLTHTHAYKPPPLDWPRMTRQQIIDAICDAELRDGETPGRYAAYDPQSGWYLLSEIIERVTSVPNHEFVQRELLEPIGCATASIGMDSDQWTSAREAGDISVLHDTTSPAREKVDLRDPVHPHSTSEHPAHPWVGDDAQRAAAHNPGGGAMGTAADLSRIYEFLLRRGKAYDGTTLLRESTIQQMTTRQRIEMKDNSFGQVIDWGLGFLINSARYGSPALPYGYGRHASDETFGHGGMQSSAGFADPAHDLAVAIIFNGLPGEPKHQKRVLETNSALYRDLGLS